MKILKKLEILKKVVYTYIVNYSPRVIQSIVVFIIFYFIARYIKYKLLNIQYKKDGVKDTKSRNKILIDICANALYYIILVIGLFSSLVILGINVNSILVLFGSIGFAVALSLKDTLSNASSGIMILLLDYFDLENYVEINGTSGFVNNFNLFTTTLRKNSRGGLLTTFPNTTITNGIIKNYNKNENIRVDVSFVISNYDTAIPVNKLISIIKNEILAKSAYVIDKKRVRIVIGQMDENSTTFIAKVPIKSVNYKPAINEIPLIIKNVISSKHDLFRTTQVIEIVK